LVSRRHSNAGNPPNRRLETMMTLTDHADPEAFQKLMYGGSSRADTRRIVRHLIGGCGRCITRSTKAQVADGEPDDPGYDNMFDRVERWLDLEIHHSEEPEPLPVAAVAAHP
jgi:hypothetical protein